MRLRPGVLPALLLGPLLLLAIYPAGAQQSGKVWRIGLLASGSPSTAAPYVEAFRRGLRQAGHVEGQDVAFEPRWAGGRSDLFPQLAADLVNKKVDLILTWGSTATTAAQRATTTRPIVFVAVGDPIGVGVVANLARPGGNITGLTNISADLSTKLLDLLNEAVPALTRIAVLQNPVNPISPFLLKQTEAAARTLELHLTVVDVRHPNEFEDAFAAMTTARVGALVVLADPMFLTHRARIGDLATKSRLPAIQCEAICGGGRPNDLRAKPVRVVPPGRDVCRQDSERCKPWRPSRGTTDQVRARGQQKDR